MECGGVRDAARHLRIDDGGMGRPLHRRAPSREPPSRTRLSRTGLRTVPERSRLHPFASRACQWPCLRGCAGADPGPGDKSDRLRGAGQALITSPLARTRARGAYLQDAVRTARTAALTPRPSGPMDPNAGQSSNRRLTAACGGLDGGSDRGRNLDSAQHHRRARIGSRTVDFWWAGVGIEVRSEAAGGAEKPRN
jgi:hypothetical protein